MKTKKWIQVVSLACSALLLFPSFAAAQSSSPNYKVEESYFGSGGNVDASSSSYRARQSLGSLAVGDISSPNYRATAGFVNPSEPFLEMGVTGGTVDFGTLSPSTTSYGSAQGGACNCSFYVRSYLSSNYSVVTVSQPPTSENNKTLTAKSVQAAPSASQSVEEFGINLVANTVPGTMGANPVNQPDNTFADGKAATGYQTAGQYKYAPGDIVAQSPATVGKQGIGQTDFTISYIAKISNVTTAGQYTMRHVLVAIAQF